VPEISHRELVDRAFLYLRTIGCSVWFKERVTSISENPDVMGFGGREFSVLIECKASRVDFLADKQKWFRKRPEDGMGYKRYFMAPVGMLKSNEIPKGWGLLEVYEKTPRMNRRVCISVEAEAFHERNQNAEIQYLVSAIRRISISMAVFIEPERIKELEAENWFLNEYKKYVTAEISRGTMPTEFQEWNQTVDKLAKELEQSLKGK